MPRRGFSEGRIEFPPTYKFDKNSDSYDTSSKVSAAAAAAAAAAADDDIAAADYMNDAVASPHRDTCL